MDAWFSRSGDSGVRRRELLNLIDFPVATYSAERYLPVYARAETMI